MSTAKRDLKKSEAVRAVALVGPTGAGKTALAQAIVSAAGGGAGTAPNTIGQSGEASFHAFDFMGDRYILFDTPGAVDFSADSDFILPGVDLALVVAEPDPDKAVLVQPFLKELERLNIPHALFINKIDAARGRIRDLLEALQPASATPLVARQIPIWKGEKVEGFIDLALERAYHYRAGQPSERIDIPADYAAREQEAHFHLLEQLADYDDALMEQLLSDVTPSPDAVFADLVRETREGLITPVFFGATAQGYGIRRLLKALRHDTPAPADAAKRLGVEGPGVYVMKISHAGQAGKLAFARVFGAALGDSSKLMLRDSQEVRPGALFALQNGQWKKASEVGEGDLAALGKIEPVAAGEVLSEDSCFRAKAAPQPHFPVYALAIATKDRKDDVRLSGALAKLAEEDPGLAVEHDQELHQILLKGQGEPHLKQVLERLKKRFSVDVAAMRPLTPYRESIRKSAVKRGRHKKQTGGHGQFGDCAIEVRPRPRDLGFAFEDKITGGAIPRQWIPAVEAGVKDAMEKGPIGYPVVDVAVSLVDGSFHSVDSSEHSFRAAGRIAMADALKECEPVLLEPIEKLTIYTPSYGTPRINSAVSSRNGQILGFEPREGWTGWDRVEVYLPHAERQDFIIELRSLTQGLATYEACFDHMMEMNGRRAEEAARRAHGNGGAHAAA